VNSKLTAEWLKATDEGLLRAGYSTSLHVASLGEVADGDVRIAFKANVPKPWAIEVFRRRAASRTPDEHDVEAIRREIESAMRTRKG
jgi:CO/xanthine dehydrogenase FAD-binding subunit